MIFSLKSKSETLFSCVKHTMYFLHYIYIHLCNLNCANKAFNETAFKLKTNIAGMEKLLLVKFEQFMYTKLAYCSGQKHLHGMYRVSWSLKLKQYVTKSLFFHLILKSIGKCLSYRGIIYLGIGGSDSWK